MTARDTPPDAAPSIAGAEDRADPDDPSGRFITDLIVAQRDQPRRLSKFPRLVRDAVAVVWATDRRDTASVVLAQIGLAGVAALQVVFGGYAVRELLQLQSGGDIGRVLVALLLLVVVSAFGSFSAGGTSQFGRLLGARVQREVTKRVLDVTTRVDLVRYDDPRFYDQLSRVLANVPTRPYSVVTSLASLIGGLAGTVAVTVALLIIQPLLVPLLFLGAVPLWWISRREGRLEFEFAVLQTTDLRERYYLEEMLSRRPDAAELRAYNTAPYIRRRWEGLYDSYLEGLRRVVRRRYLLLGLSGVVALVVASATLLLLVLLIRDGSIGLASGAAAAVAIRLLASRIQQVVGGVSTLFEAALFLSDYADFVDVPEQPRTASEQTAPRQFEGIHLSGLSFRYPGADTDAVHDLTLTVQPGEVLALVGENGSGKTTLAKMLAGLYAPDTGRITAAGGPDGDSLREWLRERVALVLQDFTKYALTAAENISLGRPERPAEREAVAHAARRVGIDSLLAGLPSGYDTRLSKMFAGGRELSLGQWQRVALARAFYRDAPLVILDEPTAALDPRAEAQLYESVRSVLDNRTVVLITHRLASVRSADRIVVMHEGALTETGTHEELIALGGRYAELLRLQQNHHIRANVDMTPSETT